MVKQKNRQSQMGYTFVELAIVLVIIGILSGSVMLGRELIESARIKSMINDFENIKQAHYLYIKRTGHAPGLSRDASGTLSFDKWKGGLFESNLYFRDLAAEGFIPEFKVGEHIVKHAYGERWYVYGYQSLFRYAAIEGPQICAYRLPIWAAQQIDAKLDDGVPNTGRVMTLKNSEFFASYAEEEGNSDRFIYNVCRAF